MNFYVITLFPEVVSTYTDKSIIGRAIRNKLIKVNLINLREFGEGKRRIVDDRTYGGGPGMVLKVEPILKAFLYLIKNYKLKTKNSRIIITSAGGRSFNAKLAKNLSNKYENLIIVCGHYEGIDERLKKILKDQGFSAEEVSVGNYVLTGGELPALIMIDAISRKIPGVLGKFESLEEERLGVGVPTYTRPDVFKYKNRKYIVPKVLLSGHHAEIEKWRSKKRKLT